MSTSIAAYKRYTLRRAYDGETFFWAAQVPSLGDWISFKFEKPIFIKRFKFKSGNAENPSDKLFNTSVLASFDPSTTPLPFLKSDHRYHKNETYILVGT